MKLFLVLIVICSVTFPPTMASPNYGGYAAGRRNRHGQWEVPYTRDGGSTGPFARDQQGQVNVPYTMDGHLTGPFMQNRHGQLEIPYTRDGPRNGPFFIENGKLVAPYGAGGQGGPGGYSGAGGYQMSGHPGFSAR